MRKSRWTYGVPAVCACGAVIAGFSRSHWIDWSWLTGLSTVAVIMVPAVCVVVYAISRKETIRAGTGWFASNNGVVRTDKLTELRVRVILSGTYVSLRDVEGRHVDIPLTELAEHPRIWELVLAGVQTSVASGLIVDDTRTAWIFGVQKRPRLHTLCATADSADGPSS